MTNNNNHNSSACSYAGQIVSYLYDEASAKEKIEFETHLNKCENCADELSGFGFVRSSIEEWRKEEIFALEMPALEIPLLKTANVAEKAPISAESNSWLADLRRLFSFSPKFAFASAAFAVLAVCVGLAFVVINFSNKGEIAVNSNQNSKNELASNVNILKEEAHPEANPNPQTSEIKNVSANDKTEQAKTDSKKDTSVKASNNAPKQKLSVPKSNTVAENSANKTDRKNKTKNIEQQEIPKLSDFDDVEDESLRLADLFNEIDTE
jgi:hypothetical protein